MKDLRTVIKESLSFSMSYREYRELIGKLLENGKTTGAVQNENMLRYTILNVQRMKKWDKHYIPDPEVIGKLFTVEPHIWLVIAEAWCGDAAHVLPVLNHLAEKLPQIELRIVLRDDNPALMDRFLTNGSRSIPILINIDKSTLKVENYWGSRPAAAQQLVEDGKTAGLTNHEYISALQIWYSRNRGVDIAKELVDQLAEAAI